MCLTYASIMDLLLVTWVTYFIFTATFGATELIIVILSQSNNYHKMLAKELMSNIGSQTQESPIVYLTHEDFRFVGAWAVTPIIPHLVKQHNQSCSWFLFVEDRTRIKLDKLNKTLEKYDCYKEIWLGYALHDREPTIIHHFAFFDNPAQFKYPNSASGFAISGELMKTIATHLQTETIKSDFSIDHAFELSLFIWNNGKGTTLTHEPAFCISEGDSCSTFPELFRPCGKLVPKESIYFAVKTCSKFHGTRIPIVQGTWGLQTQHIDFFSDVADNLIPTISLGIPNTEQGHCTKTFEIIKHVSNHIDHIPSIKWIVIADDDTILSVLRLQELLSCYNDNSMVALGERYGYNIHKIQGFNYITGGGGTVLSRSLVKKLATSACECPSLSTPDDMFLGVCLARLGIQITHSPLFHQARPEDYAPEYLQHQHVVSFHKHWMIDPVDVYYKWFIDAQKHIEL